MTNNPPVVALGYADERRSLGYLGMVIFLGSWVMMFGALFFAYAVLRVTAPAWPPMGAEPLPLFWPGISTLILLASSVTMQTALVRLRQDRSDTFIWWLLSTIVLGSVFLAVQILIWRGLWHGGLKLESGRFGSIFYLLTAFHFAHVVVGLGLLAWQVPSAVRRVNTAHKRVVIKVTSMFWHFVDIVWLAIYLSLYVL